MRLDKMLSNLGYGTRREIGIYAKRGIITVNGEVIKDASKHINEKEDEIYFRKDRIIYREFIYIMMNKPQDVVSATTDNRDQTVIDLLDPIYHAFEPFPVGRLDKDTEGLLIITNDGKLSHELLSPKKHVPKTYYARVEGCVDETDVGAFEKGLILEDGYECLPGALKIIKSGEISEIELTIMEGKFHQVKRMFEAVNKKVIYLKRISMGTLILDADLELGAYRELSELEIAALKERE